MERERNEFALQIHGLNASVSNPTVGTRFSEVQPSSLLEA